MKSRIQYLLQRHLEEDITELENDELTRLLLEGKSKEEIASFFERAIYQWPENKTYDAASWERCCQSVLANGKSIERGNQIQVGALKNRFRFAVAAAASVFLLFVTGTYLLIHRKAEKRVAHDQHPSFRNDIEPGKNRGVLTLANGSTILLDNAIAGPVAKQSGAEIVKTDSTQLIYINTDQRQTTISYNSLSTPRGGHFELQLPDGTKVWLNAESSIKYPTVFNGNERLVEMAGEAYFKVVHEINRPFKVKVGKNLIEDLGTSFNINAYDDEPATKITLAQGLLKVNNSVKLTPGRQALISRTGEIKEINADVAAEMGWKEGFFIFRATPLTEVMLQISRWYNARIDYKNELNEHFNIAISRDLPVSKLLHLLEATGTIRFQVNGNQISVYK